MSHGSPQTTFIYGKSAPVWVAVPIMKVCSYSYGGDCVTIEQYVFALLAECDGKAKIRGSDLRCSLRKDTTFIG